MGYQDMQWMTVLSLPCTVYFVWDKNHYMPQETAKTPQKETSFWAQCGVEPHGGQSDWLALWWQGACGRTRLALLKDDSTMQRKEWALHSKSSVVGEHQSVWMSTKSTAVPTLFPSALTQDGIPTGISRLCSHLWHICNVSFAWSCFMKSHPCSAGRVQDPPLLAMSG